MIKKLKIKSIHTVTILLVVSVVLLSSCSATKHTDHSAKTGYDLTSPSVVLVLPDTLREISGLTDIDSTTVACVQDENGIIFIYDIARNEITQQFTFHSDGDYEGITMVGKSLYILRSDGTIFEIEDYTSPQIKTASYETGIPANNNEGLCHDPENNRLLVACKSKLGKGPEYKDKRVIYGFDLTTKKLSDEPVYNFDLTTIKAFATNNKIELPVREKKNGTVTEPIIKFFTSAIAIHPVTKNLYVLSAADHMLFIFDRSNNLIHIELLDATMFNKSEGITFFSNNDMLITNEAQDKKPTLLQFRYIRSEQSPPE